MTDESWVRPELVALQPAACQRVRDQIAAKGGYCAGCHGTDFDVGDAMYLGFLFLDEDDDTYMVALTCRNRSCAAPKTAIRLREQDFFLHNDHSARAASWTAGDPHRART